MIPGNWRVLGRGGIGNLIERSITCRKFNGGVRFVRDSFLLFLQRGGLLPGGCAETKTRRPRGVCSADVFCER